MERHENSRGFVAATTSPRAYLESCEFHCHGCLFDDTNASLFPVKGIAEDGKGERDVVLVVSGDSSC